MGTKNRTHVDPGGDRSTENRSVSNMRVFISYAHEDFDTALKIKNYLAEIGIHVLWDRNFALGSGFHEQIKTQIAYSHIFMPIITPRSAARGWVHQEIGYAMAMNVPVLPIALKELPEAMIGLLHAVMLRDAGDVDRLNEHLPADALSLLVDQYDDPSLALYVSAEESEDRAVMFYRYASEVRRLTGDRPAMLLQSGGLSSLHIPTETIRHRIWADRYNPDDQKSLHHRRVQRRERLSLQWHACRSGARLIICPEAITKTGLCPLAQLTRFVTFVEFLDHASDEIELRHGPFTPHGESVTILGDWFMANSLIGTRKLGYRQTIFSRHAPTIKDRGDLFLKEFKDTKPFEGTGTSRENAVTYLRGEIARLKAENPDVSKVPQAQ